MAKLVLKPDGGVPVGAGRITRGFTLVELLVVVSIISVLAAIALPSYTKIKQKAKEAETKAGLHNIQLQIERFSVDHEGNYPDYLIGGDDCAYKEFDEVVDGRRPAYIIEIPNGHASDPMLRDGYVDAYPRNPFVRDRKPVKQYQAANGDPLRNLYKDGVEMGTRFGPEGNVMGQILCDPRWLEWAYYDPEAKRPIQLNTWANVQYRCYDIWATGRPKPFLPGSFMYKSMGELMSTGIPKENSKNIKVGDKTVKAANPRGQTIWPLSNSQYVLAAWGGLSNKGIDLLGEEPMVVFSKEGRETTTRPGTMFIYDPMQGRYDLPAPVTSSFEFIAIPSWTRGVNRSHVGPLWGSPYSPCSSPTAQVAVGNPNGIRDALIIVLSSDPELID